MKRNRLQQLTIGRDLITCLNDDDIAHNNIPLADLASISVTDDLHQFVVVHLVEDGKLTVRLQLKHESQARSQEDGNEDSNWLEKHLRTFIQTKKLITGDAYG